MLWWNVRRLEKQLTSEYTRKDAFRELSGLRGAGAVKLMARFAEDSAISPRVRCEAIDALGARQDDASVRVLIRLLDDQNVPISIRHRAAYALREHAEWETGKAAWALRGSGKSTAVEPLIRAAEQPELQHIAAVALEKISDQRAVPVFLRELGNAWPQAASFLDKLEPDWRKRPEVAEVVKSLIDSLVKCGRDAVLALDRIDNNWRMGAAAQAAIPVVLAALATHGRSEDRNPQLVENAARVIGEIGGVGNSEAITKLKNTYLSPYERSRSWKREDYSAMESAVTDALEKLAANHISPESGKAAHLLEKLAVPSLRYTEKYADGIRELQEFLEENVSVISSDCLRRIAAIEREVIHYTLHTTRDDEPYILPCEFNTGPCVDLASNELRRRDIT